MTSLTTHCVGHPYSQETPGGPNLPGEDVSWDLESGALSPACRMTRGQMPIVVVLAGVIDVVAATPRFRCLYVFDSRVLAWSLGTARLTVHLLLPTRAQGVTHQLHPDALDVRVPVLQILSMADQRENLLS